jgi:hypothetical protein
MTVCDVILAPKITPSFSESSDDNFLHRQTHNDGVEMFVQ